MTPAAKPSTKASSTVPGEKEQTPDIEFPWNEATVQTSIPTPPPKKETNVTSTAESGSGQARINRFTAIDEDARRRVSDAQVNQDGTSSWRAIAGIVLLILGIVAVCVWGLLPPSADKLYERILSVSQATSPGDAIKDIDEFVQRFPRDPRFAEVEALRMDVHSDWLEKRLRLKKRKSDGQDVETYEQTWREAYLIRHDKPSLAREKWESILAEYGSVSAPSPRLETVLAATRHELARLSEQKGPHESAHVDPD
jgi:hypothetical protein